MMTALATVTDRDTHGNMHDIKVSCEQKTSCNHCKSQKSCGTGIVSKALGSKMHSWQLRTDKAVNIGDVVEIGFPEKSMVTSTVVIYLLPLLFMIVGSLIGQFWLQPLLDGPSTVGTSSVASAVINQSAQTGEGATIASFFIFGGIGFFVARMFVKKFESKVNEQVSLLRVLGQSIA